MPVVLDREWGGAFYHTYALDFATEQDKQPCDHLDALRKAWGRADRKQMVAEGKSSALARAVEHPMPPDAVTKRITLVKGTALPDYIHQSRAGKIVSARLKALIKQHETPGAGYQFHPLDIVLPSGAPYPGAFFIWEVYRKVDAIDPTSESIKPVGGVVDGRHLWTFRSQKKPPTRAQLVLVRDVIEGCVAWVDFRFRDGYYFITDALFEQMQKAGITGFSAHSEWSER